MFRLDGKTALVTGAARGIGLAVSRQLADAGARVVMNDLDAEVLDEAAAQIASGTAVAADITNPDTPAQLVEAALSAYGSIDIIVNNAGYTWDSVIQKTTDEQFQRMLDVHVVAPFRLLRAASGWLRETAKKERGLGARTMRKVVNITSISGTGGNAGQVAYSSAKAAVTGMTRTLAKEWGRYAINVNAVGFGLIDTRLTQELTTEEGGIEVGGRRIRVGLPAEVLASVETMIPLGRRGTPEEAAGAVMFFCSPLSDYVTGEVLICGGGLRS